ncbi:MAG TPA: VCBS repeat-containing protein [bacterium]|nr:VCBS repeat-containing protein [bacterium]HPN33586.1 VCBS repeat-containing protein [bacterium]
MDGTLQPFSSADPAKVWGEGRFADFDNDGDVDLYSTMQVNAHDYLFANDGRLDLYVCDDEKRNRLFRNTGTGVWPDVARDLHVDNLDPTGWALDASATAVWGDYDNDGDLDLFLASQGGEYNKRSENRLYRNDGVAGFVEVAQASAIADQGQTHYAASFGDLDNDGDLDLYIQVGPSQIPPGSAAVWIYCLTTSKARRTTGSNFV